MIKEKLYTSFVHFVRMAATPNQYAPINRHITQNAQWQPWEKQEGKEKLTTRLIGTKKYCHTMCFSREVHGWAHSWPLILLVGKESVEMGLFHVLGQKCIHSTRNEDAPIHCTALYRPRHTPKGPQFSLKYTKAKIKFVKDEMPQICWPCCWCHLQPANLGDAHSISPTTLAPFYTFSAKRAPGIIQIHAASDIHPFPQD